MDGAAGYDADAQGDAVPPPAYRPAAQPAPAAARQAPRQDTRGQGGTADAGYIAPRPQAAAKPTPEALARLRAAIAQDKPRGTPAQPQGHPPQEVVQRSRFGINSLINRMTGHGDETPAAPERRQPPMSNPAAHRPAPPPQAYHAPQDAGYDDMDDGHDLREIEGRDGADGIVDPEQERIEIPAFLRRQAN
jgi:cell division protein FtsZ